MDILQEIFETLDVNRQKEFARFISRNRKEKGRKDLQALQLICSNTTPSDIMSRLYGKKNYNAYQSLRRRLLTQLTAFVNLDTLDSDETLAGNILGITHLARFLYNNGSYESGWKQLRKAEDLAIKHRLYDILNGLYNLQLQLLPKIKADIQAEDIIQKKQTILELLNEEDRFTMAAALISQNIKQLKAGADTASFESQVQSVLDRFQLQDAVTSKAHLSLQLVQILRSSIIVKKDYSDFEPYIINAFEELERKGYFEKAVKEVRQEFVYLIAHTLYRNKKFKAALAWTDKANLYKNNLTQKFTLLRAGILAFMGRQSESITLINELLNSNQSITTEIRLNAQINLAVYHFQLSDFDGCMESLTAIYHSDQWLENQMGLEWLFKKILIEIVCYQELELVELADNRIRSLERNHAEQLKQPEFNRLRIYLKLIRKLINNPMIAETKEFEEEVEHSFEWIPIEKEDLQAMGFYAWIKSKMLKQDYFQTLLWLSGQQ